MVAVDNLDVMLKDYFILPLTIEKVRVLLIVEVANLYTNLVGYFQLYLS
jgi:hypothetical protein